MVSGIGCRDWDSVSHTVTTGSNYRTEIIVLFVFEKVWVCSLYLKVFKRSSITLPTDCSIQGIKVFIGTMVGSVGPASRAPY